MADPVIDPRALAYMLYLKGGTQGHCAAVAGVTERTFNAWVKKEGWEYDREMLRRVIMTTIFIDGATAAVRALDIFRGDHHGRKIGFGKDTKDATKPG